MAIFEKVLKVDISRVNSNGKITNKGMLGLLENVACMHSDKAGYGIKEIPLTRLSWIQLNWRVQILRRPCYGEDLKICTWARIDSKVSTLRDFEVLDKDNNQLCIATTRWTLINIDTQSLTKINDDIINKYNPENISIMPDFEFKKLSEPTDFSNEYIYTTQRRDIDVNNHMHNLNYLDLAYEALPEDVYNTETFNNIEIMYKKAIRLGDTSKCLYSKADNINTVVIKSMDNKELHCIINLW